VLGFCGGVSVGVKFRKNLGRPEPQGQSGGGKGERACRLKVVRLFRGRGLFLWVGKACLYSRIHGEWKPNRTCQLFKGGVAFLRQSISK